jgi:class 3 adenylate cyclase
MKRKIAAIFAADIAGYSRLVAEDEEETLRRLASYRSVIDDFIAKAGGRIFNTAGDAVLAEFSSAGRSRALRDRYPGKPAHPQHGLSTEPPYEFPHRHHDWRRGRA